MPVVGVGTGRRVQTSLKQPGQTNDAAQQSDGPDKVGGQDKRAATTTAGVVGSVGPHRTKEEWGPDGGFKGQLCAGTWRQATGREDKEVRELGPGRRRDRSERGFRILT